MNTKSLLLVLAATLISGAALMAQDTVTPKREAQVEARAAQQQKRIAQGVASGKLTPKETQKLERRQARINRDITKAEADGKITKKEQARINAEQNRASKKIYNKKHNAKNQPK